MERAGESGGGWVRSLALVLAILAGTGATGTPPAAAQETDGAGLEAAREERSRGRAALYGAALGAALSLGPVLLTSREPGDDVGIAAIFGVAAGGAAGALLPVARGERRSRWKGALLGLGPGAAAGALALGLAWDDPSIEFDAPQKVGLGAAAGGVVGLVVGAVLGTGTDGDDGASGADPQRTASPTPAARWLVAPAVDRRGRWSGRLVVSVPLPTPRR